MDDKAVYDLTEQGRIWVDRHIGNCRTDIVSVKKHHYTDMEQKYGSLQNPSVKYVGLDVWENRFYFGRNDKWYGIVYIAESFAEIRREKNASAPGEE